MKFPIKNRDPHAKVLIHKSLFALVSGLAALRSLAGFKKAAIAMSIYSMASPLGIALGTFQRSYWLRQLVI